MPRVLATKLVVEKPVRRATGPMSPMNWAPRRAAVRFGSGLAFRRELPKMGKEIALRVERRPANQRQV
jgi:hypothetical protein